MMRPLLVLAHERGQDLNKRREMQGGLSTIAQLSSGASDVLHPYINITLECKVNRVILHSLLHIVKRWVAGRRDTRRASTVHGRLQ